MQKQLVLWLILPVIGLLALAFRPVAPGSPPRRPNILWITCEDMSPHLGSYGSRIVQTPNLDRLAAEGVRFTNAFATAGVCAPSRSALITGMYQESIGTQHMRTLAFTQPPGDAYPPGYRSYSAVVPEAVRCFPEYLRQAGYYCTNNDKEDYQFEAPPTAWDESSKRAHWRNRPTPDTPFFAVVNLTITHEGQVWARANEPLLVDPATVDVPPYYPDVPAVRQDIARHLTNVMRMDAQVGEVLAQLRADGLENNTIVFFFSDHGDGLPFVKREIYDRGIRVPLLIRFAPNFPELNPYRPAAVDAQLLSFVDLAPTVLSLAGVAVPAHMQGAARLGPQQAKTQRRYVFAARDRMDSEYDRVRSVHDGRFQYVRNYEPEKPYYQPIAFRLNQPSMRAMLALRDAGRLNATQQQWFRPTKPAEELYDLTTDPHQLVNLADRPEHRAKLNELRRAYADHRRAVGDLGALAEPDMVRRWWQGKDTPPVTAAPRVASGRTGVTLHCATAGASIGYKRHRAAPAWQVYARPLRLAPGDSLYVTAQRIGYGRSGVVTYRRP